MKYQISKFALMSLFIGISIFAFFSCQKEDTKFDWKTTPYQSLATESLDPGAVENYISIAHQAVLNGAKVEDAILNLGNPETDKNLLAAYLIITQIGFENIQLQSEEVNYENPTDGEIAERVAGYYWKWTGQTSTCVYCCGGWWTTQYYCKKRYGSSCSTLGPGVYAQGWKCASQVNCW